MKIEYLRWFALQAAKKSFDAGHWAVYGCLAADCAIARTTRLYTTKSTLATRLKLGRNRITVIIDDLTKAGLLQTDASGSFELIQPDPKWLDKVSVEATPNQSSKSAIIPHARKPATGVETPPKGVTTTPGQQNTLIGLPPRNESQASALTARQQLALYQRLGWTIPITLKQMAETSPDEVWTNNNI